MRLTIEHLTRYTYPEPVHHSLQQLRLTPRTDSDQQVLHWQLKAAGEMHAFEDVFGNHSHTLVIDVPHQTAMITLAGEIETGLSPGASEAGLPLPIYLRTTALSASDAALHHFAHRFAGRPLTDLMLAIGDHMHYRQDISDVKTTAALAFQLGEGTCRDHVHVMLACCRSLGLPARYVSGYLFTADGRLLQRHAWVEVWQHTYWLGLDVCHRTPVDERYVRLAVGLDDRGASPVSASGIGGGPLCSLMDASQSGFTESGTILMPDASLATTQAAQQQQ